MSAQGLRIWTLMLTLWGALLASPLLADQTITGNLTVTGNSDLQGDTLTLGTNTSTSGIGTQALYIDGTTSILEFDASRSANIWKWQQNGGATLQLQMSLNLSNDNELVLYNQASTPVAEVTLNPLGTSTFMNSLTVNGTDNEMPNQTLVNTNSVLTEGLANGLYLRSASNGFFGVGTTTPLSPLTVSYSDNGDFTRGLNVENTSTGTNALVGLSLSNSSGAAVGGMDYFPSNYSNGAL